MNFSDIEFLKRSKRKLNEAKVREIVGFDTETTRQGNTFLICDSENRHVVLDNGLEQILDFLTLKPYRSTFNFFYNMDFDVTGILKFMDHKELEVLWDTNNLEAYGYNFLYIPTKIFRIADGHKMYCFYDLLQYYKTSLNHASKDWLGEKKIDLDVENFEQYSMNEIIDYCSKDAQLCKRLAERLYKGVLKFMKPRNFISSGNLSEKYFRQNCYVPYAEKTPYQEYAFKSYRGGWFEAFKRGHFDNAYLYDINSAYPSEIANLLDISKGEWTFAKGSVPKDAVYGFLRCVLWYYRDFNPVSVDYGGLKLYCLGTHENVFLTLQEYEYLSNLQDVDVDIIDGWFFTPYQWFYPFKKAMMDLYQRRTEYPKDSIENMVLKLLANSLGGKFWQFRDGIAGRLFNPVYASIITANTRIKCHRLLNQDAIFVATDGVLTEKKLNFEPNKDLGCWSFKDSGEALVLGSGIYSIKGKKETDRLRGFKTHIDLFDMIKRNKSERLITFMLHKPYKLGQSISQNIKLHKLNVFHEEPRRLSPNFDKKRYWSRDFANFGEVLKTQHTSEPLDMNFYEAIQFEQMRF